MASRLELHEKLCEILGSRNVYFQPPESVKMKYPAIVYGLEEIENSHANDGVYFFDWGYSVTIIDPNPDSPIVARIAALPLCRFIRHYKVDNLNHYVFTLFF